MELNSPRGPRNNLRVLLVEDNPADALLLERTLRESPWPHELTTVGDGAEAMRYLRRQHPYGEARMPDLVLLDLNLPGKNGMEVLAEVKADVSLRIIPVIVLTSSGNPNDILRSYALGANTYLRKGNCLDSVSDLFNTLEHFWMHLAVLPTRLDRL